MSVRFELRVCIITVGRTIEFLLKDVDAITHCVPAVKTVLCLNKI